MVETLIVAAVLGALSLFAMEMLERQTRMLKTVENKFSLQSVQNQINSILTNPKNCLESLRSIDIKNRILNMKSDDTSIISSLQKEHIFIEAGETEPQSEFRAVFHTTQNKPSLKYEGISIEKYSMTLKEDNLLKDESLNGTITFETTYDLGPNTLGGRIHRKSLNLNLKFDQNDPSQLLECRTSNTSTSSMGTLSIIDPTHTAEYTGMTGKESCESIGKLCIQVISQNYASKAYGQIGIGNLCQINYNIPLKGVKQGSPVSNVHDCAAKVGQFETYKVEQVAFGVTCQGIFKAQCQ